MTEETAVAPGWTHPTGKVPDTIMIMALGPTRKDLFDLTLRHQPQAEIMEECEEFWSLNAGVNAFLGRMQYDLLFVMDYLEGEALKLPKYLELMMRWKQRFNSPIITSEAGRYGQIDGVLEYPIREVLQAVGPDNAYFHNSIPYILAYAYFIGVKKVYLFGADYAHEQVKRREDDQPNAEYWVGFCRAKGMQVVLPDTTTLCSANKGVYFYGYQNTIPNVLRAKDGG